MDQIKKECTKCNKELHATAEFFNSQKNGKYGLRSKCKTCCKEYSKIQRSTDEYKKKHKEGMAKWRKENPEKMLEVSRKSYKTHSVKLNEAKRLKLKNDEVYIAKVKAMAKAYSDSGRRQEINSKPENKEKARLRSEKRRLNPDKKEQDCVSSAEWRKQNKAAINESVKNKIENLDRSYVACSMKMRVKELTPEVYETKKLIIQLRRLTRNNAKIK